MGIFLFPKTVIKYFFKSPPILLGELLHGHRLVELQEGRLDISGFLNFYTGLPQKFSGKWARQEGG